MTESYSTIKKSFNEQFCSKLEYHLTKAFGNSPDNAVARLWCDGVKMPFVDYQLSNQSINKTHQILTEAWIGTDGQTLYKTLIKLGPLSTETCNLGLDLTHCLPDVGKLDWIILDTQKRTIEIQLP